MDSHKRLVASALVPDCSGRIFVQQRTLTRRLFPGCWDLIGGHVEEGEEVISALKREIREETGWTLRTIRHELSTKGLERRAERLRGTTVHRRRRRRSREAGSRSRKGLGLDVG